MDVPVEADLQKFAMATNKSTGAEWRGIETCPDYLLSASLEFNLQFLVNGQLLFRDCKGD